jgi:hypothetical protein
VNVGDKVRHPDFGEGSIVAVTAGEFGVAWQRREGAIGYVPRDSLSLIGRTYENVVPLPDAVIRPKTTDEKLTELIIAVNALRVVQERFLACLPYRPFEPGDS